jgi:hypothetical protein
MPDSPTPPAAPAVTYILLNGSWDRVMSNRIDQIGRPVTPGADALPMYLEYLGRSLSSLAATSGDAPVHARIWLIEIDQDGLSPDGLRSELEQRAPGVGANVTFVGHGWARPFVEEALNISADVYRSPNRLHEAMIFLAIRESPDRHLLFADPDVTFIAPGATQRFVDHLAREPGKLAAGFMERVPQRPWRGQMIPARERLHTVAVAFDAEAMRREFPLDPFIRPTTLEERLDTLRDAAAVDYYRKYRVLDSLSLFTDWARASWQLDRIVPLNERMAHFAEDSMLTIVCEDLVHAKYLQEGVAPSLRSAIATARLPTSPPLEDLLRRAGG